MTRSPLPLWAAVVISVLVLVPPYVGGARSAVPGETTLPAAVAPAQAGGAAAASPQVAHLQQLETALHHAGVSPLVAHPPNVLGARPGSRGPVAPTYTIAPAPMGVADLGLRNVSGTPVGSDLNTSSVRGSVDITRAEAVYLDGDGADTFGIQMNAVATNVTLFGVSSYQFWAQNFVSYTPSNGSLTFGDNVWNLSNSGGALSTNAFYSHGANGTSVAPIFYFAIGPTFTVAYPFRLTLYLNATDIGYRPTIFFNYSLASTAVTQAGSFDFVTFNSSTLPVPVTPAPLPQFQANGTGLDPFGLPNDLELVLVGTGAGDTTTFFSLAATFALATWDATTKAYVPIPSAVDAGSDTGETSDGVAVTFDANTTTAAVIPVAQLSLGPSFVGGLWNDSGTPGSRTLALREIPTDAFALISPGTAYNASTAQWAPTLLPAVGPRVNLTLPPTGSFFLESMLSDFAPVGTGYTTASFAPNTTLRANVGLTRTSSAGVYTPLVAWGNAELHAISTAGTGTAASPFVLDRNQGGSIAQVFGAMNDFLFPVFPGLLLINTTDVVHVTPPSFQIAYPAAVATVLSSAGLPTTNDLQIEFWNVTNVSLLGASAISGWLSADFPFSPSGQVILWGSSGNLLAGNTFYDEGVALATYGGGSNTIWGNTFLNATPPATNLSAVYNAGGNTTGVFAAESGDLVYNNYFALPAPAFTPTVDPVSCENVCVSATYTDRWNITNTSAATVNTVLGANLTGSIIGTTYQGGNYWSNYGTPSNPLGVLPYTDSGRIAAGGDYDPLIRSTAYAVSIDETGLAANTTWGITALGITTTTNGSVLTIYAPNGTFSFTVIVPAGYAGPASGAFTVNGSGTAVTVPFVPLVPLAFTESGLLSGWGWNVTLSLSGGSTSLLAATANASLTVDLAPGNYSYTVASYGYLATPAVGNVTIATSPATPLRVAFAVLPVLNVTAQGLPSTVAWTLTLTDSAGNQSYSAFAGSISLSVFQVPAGSYTWAVRAAGYTAAPASGSGDVPGSQNVTVAFAAVPSSGSSLPLGIPTIGWALIGLLAAVAVGGIAAALAARRRRPPTTTPVTPYAGATSPPPPTSPAVPATPPAPTPAPWEEGPADTSAEPPAGGPR